MTEDAVRNATIIADEETDLLVINRELFNTTVKVCRRSVVRFVTAIAGLQT